MYVAANDLMMFLHILNTDSDLNNDGAGTSINLILPGKNI